MANWAGGNSHSHVGICTEQTGLLQHILAGLPKSMIAPLQCAQNSAARLIGLVAPRDHVTSMLQQLLASGAIPHHL